MATASRPSNDAYLVKYRPEKTIEWTRQPDTEGIANPKALAAGTDGAIYMAGYSEGKPSTDSTLGGYDAFLSNFNPDGTLAWKRQLGSSATDLANALTIGANGSIYITGENYGSFDGQTANGNTAARLTKCKPDGQIRWTTLFETMSDDRGCALTAGTDGAMYLAGHTQVNLEGQTPNGSFDAFRSKFDANGNAVWTRRLGTCANSEASARRTGPDGNARLRRVSNGHFHLNWGVNCLFCLRCYPTVAAPQIVLYLQRAKPSAVCRVISIAMAMHPATLLHFR